MCSGEGDTTKEESIDIPGGTTLRSLNTSDGTQYEGQGGRRGWSGGVGGTVVVVVMGGRREACEGPHHSVPS